MNVKMEMRDLLKRCVADGVPKAQTFVREHRAHCSSDARDGRHESSPGRFVELPHVAKMPARNNQRVTRVKLSKIDKGHGESVLKHHAGRHSASDDLAKDTTRILHLLHSPTKEGTATPNAFASGHVGEAARLSFPLSSFSLYHAGYIERAAKKCETVRLKRWALLRTGLWP